MANGDGKTKDRKYGVKLRLTTAPVKLTKGTGGTFLVL